MNKTYITWEDLNAGIGKLVRSMAVDGFRPDVVLGPGRGGYIGGVMLSHYYDVPFEGFRWQTRDGTTKDIEHLTGLLNEYSTSNVLMFDDINDTGTTLMGIDNIVQENSKLLLHGNIKYATIHSKETSNFGEVKYTAKTILPDEESWIVYPYEDWWWNGNEKNRNTE